MKRAFIIAASVALGACGGGDAGSAGGAALLGLLECRDLTTRPLTEDDLKAGCIIPETKTIPAFGIYDCKDGRRLAWNDFGWGFVGEPFTEHAEGAEQVASEAARTACLG